MIGRPGGSRPLAAAVSLMRIVFLTGIWPPDVGGPATHGPEFSRFLVERGHEVVVVTMGDGEPAVQAVRGGRRLAVAPFPGSLRPRAPRSLRAGRGARTSSTRPRRTPPRASRPRCRTHAARRQARLRPGLRAGAPLRALRRDARGVSAARPAAGRGAEARSYAGASPRRRDRRPERLPRARSPTAGASTRARSSVLPNPRPGARRRAASARRPARSSSSAGSRAQKDLDVAIAPSPGCRRHGS